MTHMKRTNQKLPKAIHEKIVALSESGNKLVEAGQFDDARKHFSDAFRLVPEPKTEWEATTWILASIGDVLFLQGDRTNALAAFEDAVRCPGGLGSAFVHLRLGEIYFELGNRKRATDELARAYMAGGRDAFKREDPKYFALVERMLMPPAGMDRLP